MQNKSLIEVYKAGAYTRLSDEDVLHEQKGESGSIVNQKILIRDFLKDKKDIELRKEYADDGVSGSSFQRQGFEALMKDIEAGEINCVIVKDLSRFGREYIDAGNLLERVFPSLGVRFIAINDGIDTLYGMDSLSVALKNIMNDAYCRDISIKTRTNLAIKRKHGEFIGATAIYGYEKDPANHNKLIIDNYAGHIVQNVFLWKIQGMSCYSIAKRLNEMGVLPPYEYKMKQGVSFYTPFKRKQEGVWDPVTIRRILENKTYTGTLVQGRWTTPNHKVKKRIIKQDEECITVVDTHEALVSKRDYELVQKTLTLDTRNAPGDGCCYPLAGMLTCADCGATFQRRPRKIGGKMYVYYDCQEYQSSHRKRCSSHAVREDKVEELVLNAIQYQIEVLLAMDECIKQLDLTMLMEIDRKRLNKQITMYSAEIEKYRGLIKKLYEDLFLEVIKKDEYIELKEAFEMKAKAAEKGLIDARRELEAVENKSSRHYKWVQHFLKYQNVSELTREMVIELVDAIMIHDKNHIEIVLAFQDEYEEAVHTLNDLANREEVAACG